MKPHVVDWILSSFSLFAAIVGFSLLVYSPCLHFLFQYSLTESMILQV